MDPYGPTSWAYALRAVVLLGVAGAQALRLYRVSRRRRSAISDPTRTAPDTGWRMAMVLSACAFAAGAILFAIRPAAMRWSDALQLAGVGGAPAAIRWSGAPFVLAGLALLAAAHAALGRHFSLRIGVAPEQPLIRSGPYAFIRHPLYAAEMLIETGIVLVTGSVFLLSAAAVTTVCMIRRAAIEERVLHDHFGNEYDSYRTHSGRFLPRLRRRSRTPDPCAEEEPEGDRHAQG